MISNLIHIINGNRLGGAQQYALDICRHYRDRGVNVIALTRGARAVDSSFEADGIALAHAPLRGVLDIASVWRLAKVLRNLPKGPTVVHAHRYSDANIAVLAKSLAKRHDVRIVTTRHAVRRGRNTSVFRRLYRHIDAHIFVSKAAYDRFCRSWTGRHKPLPSQKVFILHNSLNLGLKAPLPLPEKGPVTAMYHGSIAERKGLETLIDALMLTEGTKIRLTIAGTGNPDFLDQLRRRAMARGVMEIIDWNTNCKDPLPLIARCHFGVVPSVESEAFGMSNLRFMACGRPQISTMTGARPEYLQDGKTALVVAPADAGALADAMKRLAADASLRDRLAHNAFDEFNRSMAWNVFIRHLDEIYSPSSGNPETSHCNEA